MIPTMFFYFSPLTRTLKLVHTMKSRHRYDHTPCCGSVVGLWWANGGFVVVLHVGQTSAYDCTSPPDKMLNVVDC